MKKISKFEVDTRALICYITIEALFLRKEKTMGKDLKGRELGVGISQRKDGLYTGRFTDKSGKRQQKYFHKLQECRKWLADAEFLSEHGNINANGDMLVSVWFDYWIDNIKANTVKRNSIITYKNALNKISIL